MIIYPRSTCWGKAVRLYQGDYEQVTVYGDQPLKLAQGFAALGAQCCTWWTWTAPAAGHHQP